MGLAYIASALMADGHRVSALDLNVSGLNHSRIAGIIEREHPDIVGISAMTETITNGPAVAQAIKSVAPGLTILPTTWPEYDAKHVVMETRNLSAAQIQGAVDKIVRDLGLRKATE
ncbi:MAG: cobalamin B12-binding domain-containing protein [Coriobacteriia bacterium]